MESEKCHLSGIIIRDYSNTVSNYRSAQPLSQYLEEQGVMGALSCSMSSACQCLMRLLHLLTLCAPDLGGHAFVICWGHTQLGPEAVKRRARLLT